MAHQRSTPLRVVSIAAMLAASGLVSSCGRPAEGAPGPVAAAVPVRAVDVSPASSIAITATGTLGAKDEFPLAFKIGGVVSRVAVDEGERVSAGQVLAELDLREIDAMVSKAGAAAEKARRDATRAERLHRDSVASLSQLQDAQTARNAAEADLRVAQVNREYAVIVAPTAGVVLRKFTNAGTQISSGTPVFQFGSATRGSVLRAGLADREVVHVRAGDSATVAFDAFPERVYHGRVRQVAASADPRSGTYTTEVGLADAGPLPTGLIGRVRIITRGDRAFAGSDVMAVPAEALVDGEGDRGVVFILDETGQTAVRRTVTLVGVRGEFVLVRGLAGAARVITAGAAWLTDSARVEVKP
jgi:multidrug efflux system membrane fusion protein